VSIVVSCHFCGKRYRFKDEQAGQVERCEECGDVLQIPRPILSIEQERALPPELRGEALKHGRLPESKPPWLEEEPRPIDPRRPAVSDQMYRVGVGMTLILWDVSLTALIHVLLVIGPYFLEDLLGMKTMFRFFAGLQLVLVGVMILGMVGRSLCLLVPKESQAKTVIAFSVVLEFYSIVVEVIHFFMNISPELYASRRISIALANVLFLGFLRKLANYLQRNDLIYEAQKALALGAVFVALTIVAVTSRFFFPPINQLFTVASFFILPLAFFPHVRLLSAFRKAFRPYK